MNHTLRIAVTALAIAGSAWAAEPIKKTTFTFSLTSPVSSKTSKQGDQVTCRVMEPADFAGAIVTGKVVQVSPPQKGMAKPESTLVLGFETLTITKNGASEVRKIKADVREIKNSKGVAGVDEEGRAVAKPKGKTSRWLGAAAGAATGIIAARAAGGGGATTAIGAGAGAVAGYVITAQLTTSSEAIDFGAGTQFVAEVNEVK